MSEGDMTATEYLNYIAGLIVEMEDENDCVGATRLHIQELGKKTQLPKDDAVHVHTFFRALGRAGEQKEVDNEFLGIVYDLTGGETE